MLTTMLLCCATLADTYAIENEAFRLELELRGGVVLARLVARPADLVVAHGPLCHRATRAGTEFTGLRNATVESRPDGLLLKGALADLDIEQSFTLPRDRPILEERITVTNGGQDRAALSALEIGFTRRVAGGLGTAAAAPPAGPAAAPAADRWVAVPLRKRTTDADDRGADYSLVDLVEQPGWEPIVAGDQNYAHKPSRHRVSEGWAWLHGDFAVGIFKFSQQCLQWSVVSQLPERTIRFGGACLLAGEPAALGRLQPGERVDLGVTRYELVRGGYTQAAYAFRRLLDEHNCRFPKDYDPPVHWEQLYDMDGAWDARAEQFTKARLFAQCELANAFSCAALYLDPGWDTSFASFIWGVDWLGPRRQFIDEVRARYGLKVALHAPLAAWMSAPYTMGPSAEGDYPESVRRKLPPATAAAPEIPADAPSAVQVCSGARQYLDVAAERLLASCADGVVFLMFDGNWFTGPCIDKAHGHPIPYRWEDHFRANLALAQRIHARYPAVLIEMHDMLVGGHIARPTPVYYTFGLPGSYDENWGFELMWDPMKDMREGRATPLYYYNLGCNVPAYLHIDLRKDNRECLVLWWYASTCRHLGIGGTHADPAVVQAQQAAMRWYKAHAEFFKRGEFYGPREDVHFHVLPDRYAFVVNLFNLSDDERDVGATVPLAELGLDPARAYVGTELPGTSRDGAFRVEAKLPPWSARVGYFAAP